MFTGIVESVGEIRGITQDGSSIRVRIAIPKGWRLRIGESISVDGVCSTVASLRAGAFEVVYMPETLKKTNAAALAAGVRVNLERSVRADGRFDGHFVAGHVDAVSRIVRVQGGDAYEISFALPAALRPLVVPLGSVALNGVSLTVARVRGEIATVALVPHTLAATNLGTLEPGCSANVEADMLARYAVAGRLGSGRVVRHAKKRIRAETDSR